MSSRVNLIKEWGRSRNRAEQIASVLGERIVKGEYEYRTFLPPVAELAKEFDVHKDTIGNAKRVLGHHHFLKKEDGRWVVA